MNALGSLMVVALAAGPPAEAEAPRPHVPPGGVLLGFFTGTLPCPDCEGIRTELTLLEHGYWLKETHLGKGAEDAVVESRGDWLGAPAPDRGAGLAYHLTEAHTRESHVFLKRGEDELELGDSTGRPIRAAGDRTLRRQPVPDEPVPHAAPAGTYLVDFYAGTVPGIEGEGQVRLELSLFGGEHRFGLGSYRLRETRVGAAENERVTESSGFWRRERRTEYVQGAGKGKSEARDTTVLELIGSGSGDAFAFQQTGPDELLVKRRDGKAPEGGATITRRVAAIPGATFLESIGCVKVSSGGIDTVGGNTRCGSTLVAYDIGRLAGDGCREAVAMDVTSVGHEPMKMCVDREGSMRVVLPELFMNLWVAKPTAEDTMALLHVGKHLAERHRANQAWADRDSDQKADEARP